MGIKPAISSTQKLCADESQASISIQDERIQEYEITDKWMVGISILANKTDAKAREASTNRSRKSSRISTPCSQNARRSSTISRSISAIHKRQTFCL
jgi:hypothetical protein